VVSFRYFSAISYQPSAISGQLSVAYHDRSVGAISSQLSCRMLYALSFHDAFLLDDYITFNSLSVVPCALRLMPQASCRMPYASCVALCARLQTISAGLYESLSALRIFIYF